MLQIITLAAAVTLSSPLSEVPRGVTPIAELGAVDRLEHAEVLQVRRDFGQPDVNVALDAWLPRDGSHRIDAVRLWWSDAVERFPFSEGVYERLAIDVRRLSPERWRVTLNGEGQRVAFDVALDGDEPVALADVTLPDGRVERDCRVDAAQLYARRVLGIPVGLRSMIVSCTATDGAVHRAPVASDRAGRRRAGRGERRHR